MRTSASASKPSARTRDGRARARVSRRRLPLQPARSESFDDEPRLFARSRARDGQRSARLGHLSKPRGVEPEKRLRPPRPPRTWASWPARRSDDVEALLPLLELAAARAGAAPRSAPSRAALRRSRDRSCASARWRAGTRRTRPSAGRRSGAARRATKSRASLRPRRISSVRRRQPKPFPFVCAQKLVARRTFLSIIPHERFPSKHFRRPSARSMNQTLRTLSRICLAATLCSCAAATRPTSPDRPRAADAPQPFAVSRRATKARTAALADLEDGCRRAGRRRLAPRPSFGP